MKSPERNKINWIVVISLVCLVIIAFTTFQTFVIFRDNTFWVIHTYKVQEAIESLLSHLKDAETGQRGYLIAGEESYLEPFNISLGLVEQELSSLKELTLDNPEQQNRFPSLELLITSKIFELNETIELRRNKGFKAARQVVLTHKGKQEMDKIRQILKIMKNEENTLLMSRVQAEMKSFQIYHVLLLVLFGIFIAVFFLIKNYFELKHQLKVLKSKYNEA